MAKLIRTTAWLGRMGRSCRVLVDRWSDAEPRAGNRGTGQAPNRSTPTTRRVLRQGEAATDEYSSRNNLPRIRVPQPGPARVYEVYPEETFPAIKRHPKVSWGTYAYRLVRRKTANGKDMNPLKQMIDKMKMELAMVGTMRSCFEIGVTEAEYELPLYSTLKDGKRGQPAGSSSIWAGKRAWAEARSCGTSV